MRVCYLFIAAMLLLASCSSGGGQHSALENPADGITLDKPLLDGPDNHHPGWYQLDVQQTESGLTAVVRVTPDEEFVFTQFDLLYDAGGLNPLGAQTSDESVLTLAPLRLKGRIPVTLASTGGRLGPVEFRAMLEQTPFRQTSLSTRIPCPEVYGVSLTGDGLLIDGGMVVPGDYNFDGRVTGQDLFPIATHFNFDAMGAWRCIDGNGDGKISGLDVFTISAYFGLTIEGYSLYAQPMNAQGSIPLNSELIPYSAPLGGECLSRFEFLDSEANDGAYCYTARTAVSNLELDGMTMSDPSDDLIFSSTPTDPIITSLIVNGDEIDDGQFVGSFTPGSVIELRVDGVDPDGGDVWFNWSGTGDTLLIPSFGKIVQLTNPTIDKTENVYVTITDDDGGAPQTWSFSYRFGTDPVIRHVKIDGHVHYDGDFIGGIDRSEPIFCEVLGYDPDRGDLEWDWEGTGAVVIQPVSETKCYISNPVLHTTETVTITATNEHGKSARLEFSFYSGIKPTISRMLVDGNEVEDGGYAGNFRAVLPIDVECFISSDYEDVTWEATGNAVVNPADSLAVQVSNWDVDTLEKVTVTASGGPYGPYSTRCFLFDTCASNVDEMSFTVVPHPDEPDERIRLILSVSDMMLPTMGVSLDFNYDHDKLYAVDTRDYYDDDDDCHAHWDGPWGENAVTLFFPELEPANMTCSGFEPATQGGHVFYVDFKVIDGHGTTTDFTFGERETCLFSNEDGMSCRMALRMLPALNVELP